MKKRRLMVLLAFLLLVIVATIIGCTTAGEGFLIPVQQESSARFAFVVNGNPDPTNVTISAYRIDASTGALTAAPGSPFPTDVPGCCGSTYIDVDPNSRFVFVPNRDGGEGNGTVSVFSVDQSTGALSAAGSPVDSGGINPFAAKLDPTGKFLYVANKNSPGTVAAFTVGSNGTLTSVGTQDAQGEPYLLMMDPKGRFVYATIGTGGLIMGWSINAGTGALSPVPNTPFTIPCEGRSGTVDFTGTFLVVADKDCDQVSVLKINQSTGELTPVTSVDTGVRPFHVVEAASGGKFYMAVNNMEDADITVFQFDPTSGSLTPAGSDFVVNNFTHPHYMAVDTAGKFGYIVDWGSPCCTTNATITGVTVDASGNLTQISGSPFTTGGIKAPAQIVLGH